MRPRRSADRDICIHAGVLPIERNRVGPPSTYPRAASTLIEFDEQLHEIRRVKTSEAYYANVVFRLPDRTFLLFGAQAHATGEPFTSDIVHVSSMLERLAHASPDRTTVEDSGAIYAAAPMEGSGKFLFATVATARGLGSRAQQSDTTAGFLRGARVECVEVK